MEAMEFTLGTSKHNTLLNTRFSTPRSGRIRYRTAHGAWIANRAEAVFWDRA